MYVRISAATYETKDCQNSNGKSAWLETKKKTEKNDEKIHTAKNGRGTLCATILSFSTQNNAQAFHKGA